MSQPNQEGFIRFIKNQERDREIDHTSWGTCAVGNYLDSIDSGENSHYFANNVLEFRLMEPLDFREGGENYGELQDFLKENNF